MRFHSIGNRVIAAALCALFVAGCRAGRRGSVSIVSFPRTLRTRERRNRVKGIDKIQHVVIIVQENRSFNNLFYGYPGAKTSKYGKISTGKQILIQPVSISTKWDLEHNSGGFIRSCNGTGTIPGTNCRMNGFDKQTWSCDQPGKAKCPIKYPPYAYVPHDQITAVLRHGRVSTCSPTSSMPRTSTRAATSRINTSSPELIRTTPPTIRRRSGAVPAANLTGSTGSVPNREITLFPKDEHPCSDVTTLGDELDAARVSLEILCCSRQPR